MPSPTAVATKRPAETAAGLTADVVAILVATTHLSTPLATARVVVVGALPGLVTSIVSATRSTAAGTLLGALTPKVKDLAESALDAGATQPAATDKNRDADRRSRRVGLLDRGPGGGVGDQRGGQADRREAGRALAGSARDQRRAPLAPLHRSPWTWLGSRFPTLWVAWRQQRRQSLELGQF